MKVISENFVKKISGGNQEELSESCQYATINFLSVYHSPGTRCETTAITHLFDHCTAEELAIVEKRIKILKGIKEQIGNGRV